MGAFKSDDLVGFWAYLTVSGGTASLINSFNVTSITDGSTGIFTITIATDFSSANWVCLGTAAGTNSNATNAFFLSEDSDLRTAGVCVMNSYNGAATQALADGVSYSVAGFGTQ